MKKLIAMGTLATLMVACSSFKPDYKITDASANSRPNWIEKAEKADSSSVAEKNRYFIDFSENANQRLCREGAKSRATAKVAAEVSQHILGIYHENTKGSLDAADTTVEEKLKREINTGLTGVQEAATYWEKRQYMKEMGAAENKQTYFCYAVVKMDRDRLEKAMKIYEDKLVASIKAPEVKAKVSEAMTEGRREFVSEAAQPVKE